MDTVGEKASSWLKEHERLADLDDGEGDAEQNLRDTVGLLRALHSEDVSNTFLQELWETTGSWERLRQKEATLRAMANEYAAAVHWKQDDSLVNWELLRPTYTPELSTDVASAVASVVQANPDVAAEKSGPTDAEKYINEKEDDGLINLYMDTHGNLETMLQASENDNSLQAGTAVSLSDWHCVEGLCKVTCDDILCKHPRSLCWHCWRKEDGGERHPAEYKDLLSYARQVAETAAPLQRASEVALSWPFLQDVAVATVEKLKELPSGAGVLVLGGVGVSAVRAAKECAANVIVWEPSCFLARTLRDIASINDLGNGSVQVVGGDEAALEAAIKAAGVEFKLIVVDGLEMDGLLGFGTLKQLSAVVSLLQRLPTQQGSAPSVVPTSLHISVRLADARVAEVSGFNFDAFARVSKSFAPFLSTCGTNATSAKPKVLTEEVDVFTIDLQAAANGIAGKTWDWPDGSMEKQVVSMSPLSGIQEGAAASAVLVSFSGSCGAGSQAKRWSESIFYIPPVVVSAGTQLSCFRNSSKVWFEVGAQLEKSSTMPSHGPPFGHAFIQEWYLDMYRDIDRNDFYEEGLRRWVQKHRKQNGKGGRVMDIGSGTGLLLFFALRAGADEAVGVEVAPNLKRMSEALYAANVRAGKLPMDRGFKVLHNDANCLQLPEEERPQCLVTEMMDGSGLGEGMVRVILHAKAQLLASGAEGEIVPRKLKIKAVLLNIHLPQICGVDLSPLEAYWGPTRALGCEGELANLDLDNAEAGVYNFASKVVEVWCADFSKSAEEIAEAMRSRMVEFPLIGSEDLTVNAVAWWFEAHLDDSDGEEPPPPILTNVPVCLREGPTGGGTHWHQAVSVIGPFEKRAGDTLALKAHTDGRKLTWTSKDPIAMTDAITRNDARRESWMDYARKAEENAQRSVWQRQRMAKDVGDVPRLAALQAAAMHVGTQPGLFGVFGGASVASHILKEWFGAGCSSN
eukprot:TRINITY_DN11848_c1_g7_i1.p1 TRINITY_DN11848_c1_g7~~TRINITY_DN11848_c1_g7_i1.p1  ORF type:complete len:984 (-),score=196.69 TRINITY_DN11848_c1_g7_i1:102-3008(-)